VGGSGGQSAGAGGQAATGGAVSAGGQLGTVGNGATPAPASSCAYRADGAGKTGPLGAPLSLMLLYSLALRRQRARGRAPAATSWFAGLHV